MKRLLYITALVIVACSVPALADWSSAESADFTLDTTIPEPGVALAIAVGMVSAIRRNAR